MTIRYNIGKVMQDTQERITAVRKWLRYGDLKVLAEITGFSAAYVQQVLDPKNARHNEAILEAAEQYTAYRVEQSKKRLADLIGQV